MDDYESDEFMMDEESDFGSDFSGGEENCAPVIVKKKAPVKKAPAKKAAPKKKAAAKKIVLELDNDDNDDVSILSNSNAGNVAPTQKTVEERYQKKSHLEHILARPDTYVGSTKRTKMPMYILNSNNRIVEKEITYTPGLYKIFDEIVVNAADNKQRDPNMNLMEINIDAERNVISVKNNGDGIPIEWHKKEECYVPSMIFGQLLTGSNFDDDEKKTTGGRNGYGAKLANVFSKEFIVDIVDVKRGKSFHQVFRNNMSVAETPTITNLKAAQKKEGDSVKITFSPDLARFQMDRLDEDAVGLFSKRAYDIAGTLSNRGGKRLNVTLNGIKLPIKSFKDYCGLLDNFNPPTVVDKSERWEIGVGSSKDGVLQQVSFVNSISTSNGGTHVTYIADQVAKHLVEVMKKKNKGGAAIKKAQIVNHMSIMINCLIENPSFDSQTKDKLNSRKQDFGSKFELTPALLKKIEKSDIVQNILAYANFKDKLQLKKKSGTKKLRITGIVKLDDANFAGGAKSKDCTLIITEGDSAKSLAMAGLSVVGRDTYGVFPLRGKPLNVRDVHMNKVCNNSELNDLVNILGLKFQTVYDSTNIKTLRYGHLMIMADQDTDGSHIKGLIINFLHCFWPSLLDVPGFLQQFITPIVKISKGKFSRSFFNLPEYEQWIESTGNQGKGYGIKYYKGLGTSTSAEAKEYFSSLDVHEKHFDLLSNDKITPDDDDEHMQQALPDIVESGSDLIDMVFRKDRVTDRKKWLNDAPREVYLDYSAIGDEGVKYSDFINKEYILFSSYDNERSIPNAIDGLKPSQRKVLFGCLKRKLHKEIKVAQLVGSVAELASYHHGEASLQGTIVNMAQNFVGSNNINLLTPSGQFGTRRMGGQDAASPRYIFTKLEPITRTIFHPDDDELLNYLKDDVNSIEPDFYVPVIPIILINGGDGIGTGWSSTVSNYNPREVIANLRRKIAGDEMVRMDPYYCGFSGDITLEKEGKYAVKGKIERLDDTTLKITELPIKKWTQTYKEFLEPMIVGDKDKGIAPTLLDVKENHTETTVSFTMVASKETIDGWEKGKKGLYDHFKLNGSITETNMTLFDRDRRLVKYDTTADILNDFYNIRLEFYGKRKDLLIRKLQAEKCMLTNKARFVEEVCSGDLVVSNRKRVELLEDLQTRGYDLLSSNTSKKSAGEENTGEESDEDDEPSTAELAKGYEYLLGLKIWSLTYEKAEQLRKQLEEKAHELDDLEATSPSDIWSTDLDAIDAALDDRDEAMSADAAKEQKAMKKNKQRQAKKKVVRKKKKKDEWDSEEESESDTCMEVETDEEVFPKKSVPRNKPAVKPKVAAKVAKKKAPATKKIGVAAKANAPLKTKSQELKRPPSPSPSDSDSDDVGESLIQRMQKKLVVSPPPKKAPIASDDKKRSSPRLDSDSSECEVAVLSKPRKTEAKAKKPPARKKTAALDFDDSSVDEVGSEADAPIVRAPARAKRAAVAKTKPTYAFSSSDEDDDDDDDLSFA